jgi:hypothetical protein
MDTITLLPGPTSVLAERGFSARTTSSALAGTLSSQSFEQLLVSGGDERIAIDPNTGRNRYGTPGGQARNEIWFSSSTACAISPRGHDAALEIYRSVVRAHDCYAIPTWFNRIRARLARLFAIPGTTIILSGSGTELELIALCLARSILRQPLTNLVIAPEETGRGVPLAGSGRHFLGSAPFCEMVERGSLVDGLECSEISTEIVEIRDQHGSPLSLDYIDDEVVQRVEASIANGRAALIHLLDCSKTNCIGLRRSAASALMARYAGRALVVVDSCQLRCAPEQIRADLQAGFMVMITGSKFAGGPPFAGAILIPPKIIEQLQRLELPSGLLSYTAAEDWPAGLRSKIGCRFIATRNIGAGLRWEAALAELERFFALPDRLREAVAAAFASAVEKYVRDYPCLQMTEQQSVELDRTIFPIVTVAENGTLASEAIHRALRKPLPDSLHGSSKRIFHVGQPVHIGHRSALRVCLSMPQVVDAAENMARGQAFEAAIGPLMADIEGLFSKWARIADELCRQPQVRHAESSC